MDIHLFDFVLPNHLIAQHPLVERDQSKLLVMNKVTGDLSDKRFFDIVNYFRAGDVLVRNNTQVIPARLFGIKKTTGAHIEFLLLRALPNDHYEVLVGNAKAVKVGTEIVFKEGVLHATCIAVKEEGIRIVKFTYPGIFLEVLEQLGETPIPPYIKEKISTKEQYQTIYAKVPGSAAAPTAGFHFTQKIFDQLKQLGVTIVDVTLNVGLGTFRPVKVNNIHDHVMHDEWYSITEEAAQVLNEARTHHRRIIAVGTTSMRTLESNVAKFNQFKAVTEPTNLYITPGYTFKAVSGLITNFHLPKSTLLMLVSAFSTRELILNAYHHAIKQEYRFFSFGDAMLIIE
jgi:S-adenosylmethionine:tRNA ribosyltransferase-isomerase